MFTFGFDTADAADAPQPTATTPAEAAPSTLRPARDVLISERLAEANDWPLEVVTIGRSSSSVTLHHAPPPEVGIPSMLGSEEEVGDASVSADASTSDLIPCVYEGGFKVWECTHDLLSTLHEMSQSGELQVRETAVLEAGCGAGLPGALAMRLGARACVMCDFNPSVLSAVTMRTLDASGLWQRAEAGRVRFLSGDWGCVSEKLTDEQRQRDSQHTPAPGEGQADSGTADDVARLGGGCSGPFDLLLSSETIYSPEAAGRLWHLVRSHLAPGGTALVAAKSYYFGVGGSVAAFQTLVTGEGAPEFTWRALRTFEDGASNRREVFAINRRANSA